MHRTFWQCLLTGDVFPFKVQTRRMILFMMLIVTTVNAADYIGCFSDSEPRLLLDEYIDDEFMTVDTCVSFCRSRGWLYAGVEDTTQCFCGSDIFKEGFGFAPESECSFTCGGSWQQICGGDWRISVYKAIPDNYVGCYADSELRLLGDEYFYDIEMTVGKCLSACRGAGFRYAALGDSVLCFCGNDISKEGYGLTPETECNAICGGDPQNTCGGPWRLSIYRTKPAGYEGCFVDAEERLLGDLSAYNTSMTIEDCILLCSQAGYIYAGVEDAYYCFCGNDPYKDGYGLSPESECYSACGGNCEQPCGGPWRLSVYRTKSENYIGCYYDDADWFLDGYIVDSNDMSVDKCFTICSRAGFSYFGVESGTLCFCGDNINQDGYALVPESGCSIPCAGNKLQMCGGDWTVSIYRTKPENYVGCYYDQEVPLLEAKLVEEYIVTPERCMTICSRSGYMYAGVEGISKCFCGNNVYKIGYEFMPEDRCSFTCGWTNTIFCAIEPIIAVFRTQPDSYVGCFLDMEDRLLEALVIEDPFMTLDVCLTFCSAFGYMYAGVEAQTLCFCGDNLMKEGYIYSPESECSLTCGWNNQQICGGPMTIAVYKTKRDSYVGCFLDDENRLLEAIFIDDYFMTVDSCLTICSRLGYRFAGLEGSTQCTCGNDIMKDGYGLRPESECSALCGWNRQQICGGEWRLSVYRTRQENYMGCYYDQSDRILDGAVFEGLYMTVDICLTYCSIYGYMYAGLENQTQCFCGSDIMQLGYEVSPDYLCSPTCGWNGRQICGDSWAISIYRTKAEHYVGCYMDDEGRLFDSFFIDDMYMDVDKCIFTCSRYGFLYAGLENGTQCFCGNNIAQDGYGVSPEWECSTTCRWNRQQICGGYWRLSIYRTKSVNYHGCYTDQEDRLLDTYLLDDPYLNMDTCMIYCGRFGYMYAGVENATQCFCGNDVMKEGYVASPESQCSFTCGLNRKQMCGGEWSIAVFKTRPDNYMGCFFDDESRLLEAVYIDDAFMTIDKCLTICSRAGYLYAGVEFATLCLCGNNLYQDGYAMTPDSECYLPCGGNALQICGGSWRMSVYSLQPVNHRGCYVDQEVRLLGSLLIEDIYMTVDNCVALCGGFGYMYAGVEGTTMCFCGNNIMSTGYEVAPLWECSATCGWNGRLMCGGEWTISVCQTRPDNYMGCFVDNEENLLDGLFIDDVYMTVDKCKIICSRNGFKYAGVEFSVVLVGKICSPQEAGGKPCLKDEANICQSVNFYTQCFCGNVMYKEGYGYSQESECSAPCGGNPRQMCGGLWRIAVYQTRPDNYQGCYTDMEVRLLEGLLVEEVYMTVDRCQRICGSFGYMFAGAEGLSQCFCGNEIIKSGFIAIPEADCSATCGWNNKQMCGGDWSISVYQIRPENYVGCFIDNDDRLLDAIFIDDAYMTIDICLITCSRAGYMFAGVEFGTFCLCGNTTDKAGYGYSPEAACSLPCGGNPLQVCGGTMRISVYRTKTENYRGCYIDQGDRLLEGLFFDDPFMTVDRCFMFCNRAGFMYAGFENKTQCYCGNDLMTQGYVVSPESECSATCGWNNQQMCGGEWTISVFKTRIENYIGCFIDKEDRLLNGLIIEDIYMTVDKCISICSKAGYMFAGVEASIWCFCGNDTQREEGYGFTVESECYMTCGGNPLQLCGGGWRLSVYRTKLESYIGCYVDQTVRLLGAAFVDDLYMTVDTCLIFCGRGGYMYAGVENQTLCFCGDDLVTDGYAVSPESECSTTCGWNNQQICGGEWVISIFKTRPENYVGCYTDQEMWLLDGLWIDEMYMTIEKCFLICSRSGFMYAGLEFGTLCLCGNDISKDGYDVAPAFECSTSCGGDPRQMCGGIWRLSIYKTKPDNYRGCYFDNTIPLLDGFVFNDLYMTVDLCVRTCSQLGYMYAGVENLTDCFCGNNMMKDGYLLSPEFQCSTTCGWNNQQICGFPWVLAIYQTKPESYIGCYTDLEARFLDGAFMEDVYMTIDKCIIFCSRSGYIYAGLEFTTLCFCGSNILRDGYSLASETECFLPCGGNLQEFCGGEWRLSIYRTKPDNYMGCYLDDELRLLEAVYLEDVYMTIENCLVFCLETGYMYAGVQDGSLCFCGNDIYKNGYGYALDTECSIPCGGNPVQMCGGSWRLSVYRTKQEYYKGCYIDDEARLLEAAFIDDGGMTVDKCLGMCLMAGYLYAGLQNSTICFCGDNIYQNGYGLSAETECSMFCGGDPFQICGGNWRMSVYRTKPEHYIGCYTDAEVRLLEAEVLEDIFMTVDKCLLFCMSLGYTYSGLQDATLCFCGNYIYKDGYGRSPETECSVTCGGNPGQICGGDWRLSVYRTKAAYYEGCYIDDENRFFDAIYIDESDMTVDKCKNFCNELGYMYAGLQDSTLCFCGDDIYQDGYGRTPETGCSAFCGGNPLQLCGGYMTLSIYRTKSENYVGCYIDNEVRLLEAEVLEDIYMTVETCVMWCLALGYSYAGTQEGIFCFCGNNIMKEGYGFGLESECSVPCGGDPFQMCGGGWRLSVYKTRKENYLGCYVDNVDRLLGDLIIEEIGMTVGTCTYFCRLFGYKYAGLQAGILCFCGNDLTKDGYGRSAEIECSAFCGGYPFEICGGDFRLSVYRVMPENYVGCYIDNDIRLLADEMLEDIFMTVGTCVMFCNILGYKYAGLQDGILCFCGNEILREGYGFGLETECNAICGGDPYQICGGAWRLSVYRTKPEGYEGCYIDDENRLFDAKFLEASDMTVDKCTYICRVLGYLYAALQGETLCFCGNDLYQEGYGISQETECSLFCGGDPFQMCGGFMRLSLYRTKRETYIGCYVDFEVRLLEAVLIEDMYMTVDTCLLFCMSLGYMYAGLQDGIFCFCGNNIMKEGYGYGLESECSAYCGGDPFQMCGGSWRLSVYRTKAENYMGCYIDDEARLLEAYFLDETDMNAQECTLICLRLGFMYAGLQANTFCFCGNNLMKNGYGLAPEIECSAFCGGDPFMFCGGEMRLSVYRTKAENYVGCYIDNEARLLANEFLEDIYMTVETCLRFCAMLGYTYAGTQEGVLCFCGNEILKTGYGYGLEAECNAPCGGDPYQMCGGSWRLSVYRTRQENYQGCYVDDEERLFDGKFVDEMDMTVEKCVSICRWSGYTFAGLQGETMCFCGNDMLEQGYGMTPEIECLAVCGGDPFQFCGGFLRLSIYRTRSENYMGCYIDDEVRLLEAEILEDLYMTPEKCFLFCLTLGYGFFGVEAGTFCFCGNEITKEGYGLGLESECSSLCGGDPFQICGGGWRLSAYRTRPENYIGCYVDDESRLLEAEFFDESDMSIDKCIFLCTALGYWYAGVQGGSICFCGDDILKEGYAFGLETECSAFCFGNPFQICGGEWRTSIYRTKPDSYHGCYTDDEFRLLKGELIEDLFMTVEKCMDICGALAYSYYGVEFGIQCFCGNNIDKEGYARTDESECNLACGGNSRQMCGGTLRISVYITITVEV